jgi:hypothetical protein
MKYLSTINSKINVHTFIGLIQSSEFVIEEQVLGLDQFECKCG